MSKELTMERRIEYVKGDVRFYVWEGERVVQFVCSLGFGMSGTPGLWEYPRGTDLGYHSPVPMYEGHAPMEGDCSWTSGPCYYDGTSLGAKEPMRVLSDSGEDALFTFLENHWRRVFEENQPESFGHIVATLMGGPAITEAKD